jgi:HSP20 family protein
MGWRDWLPWRWGRRRFPIVRETSGSLGSGSGRALPARVDALGDWLSHPRAQPAGLLPTLDVESRDDRVSVRLEVPGLDAKNTRVAIEDDTLVIRGERSEETRGGRGQAQWTSRTWSRFERAIPLPAGLDLDSAEAFLEKGVLTIRIRRDPAPRHAPRIVEIETA